MPNQTILALPDIHYPFQHQAAVDWALSLIPELKPDVIVQVGDLYDQFSTSKYSKLIKMPVEEEIELARGLALTLWERVNKLAPKAKKYQLVGNHDNRPLKKALVNAPELAPFVGKTLKEYMTFPGVKTIHDEKEELFIGDICIQHGYRKFGEHAVFNQMSTICGHLHTGQIKWFRNRQGPFFELNCGFLGDVKQDAFTYRTQKYIHSMTLGVGAVDKFGPRFIPYPGGK